MSSERYDIQLSPELRDRLRAGWEASLPSRCPLEPDPPHRFSPRFLRRMEALCRRARPPLPWRRGLALLSAALLLAATVAAAAPGLRGLGYREVIDTSSGGFYLNYERVSDSYTPGDFLPYCLSPGFVPEGYARTARTGGDSSQEEVWTGASGSTIRFRQRRLDKGEIEETGLLSSYSRSTPVRLDDLRKGRLLEGKDGAALLWDDGAYAFSIAAASLDREELLLLARTLEPVELPDYEAPFLNYEPGWTPEGFVPNDYYSDECHCSIIFRNSEGEEIHFAQTSTESGYCVDDPEVQTSRLLLDNGAAAWHISVKGMDTLTWLQDGYQMEVSSIQRPLEELLRVANSVAPVPEGARRVYPGPFKEETITALPEGCTLVRRWVTVHAMEEKWLLPGGDGVLLFQKAAADCGRLDREKEKALGRPVTLGENWPGWYREEGDTHILHWASGFHLYRILAPLPLEEMIPLADSVQPILHQLPESEYAPFRLTSLCDPAALPRGFDKVQSESGQTFYWAKWRRDGVPLAFQVYHRGSPSPLEFPSANRAELPAPGGHCLYGLDDGVGVLVWFFDGYELELTGPLPMEELVEIASSVPPPTAWFPDGEWGGG